MFGEKLCGVQIGHRVFSHVDIKSQRPRGVRLTAVSLSIEIKWKAPSHLFVVIIHTHNRKPVRNR